MQLQMMNSQFSKMNSFDFLVVGSGFAGSITAMCLKQKGYSVSIIEKDKHPRFSVGESSTPIADMILRSLSDRYNLPFLKNISRYGTWQTHYPELVCGLKRGFSYYFHQRGMAFTSDQNHENELLVAASFDDENSDTNWLRSDVDQFLVQKAIELGVEYFEKAEINSVVRQQDKTWSVRFQKNGEQKRIATNWIIDATGSPGFSGRFFGTKSSSDDFLTNTSAVYSHFEDGGRWFNYLQNKGFFTGDYPYNPDDSALHQIIEEGWVWMLRFNNDLLSAGIVSDNNTHQAGNMPAEHWRSVISKYPSLNQLFKNVRLADEPGTLIRSGRLQRKLDRSHGDGWLALSHTFGFVDPLHSTGIAFSLAGVERILALFEGKSDQSTIRNKLKFNHDILYKELQLIDMIVSISYLSRFNFKLFSASVMIYFIASIRYEQSRLMGVIPESFLCAGDSDLFSVVDETHYELQNLQNKDTRSVQIDRQIEIIRKRIEPFNHVGLMDPAKRNMYRHTAVEF